jgi:hypothetical protein
LQFQLQISASEIGVHNLTFLTVLKKTLNCKVLTVGVIRFDLMNFQCHICIIKLLTKERKENMAEKKTYTFIVSDESVVNSYGFRVMTAGISLVQFKRNPIVLWYHKRPSRWESNKDDSLPIGRAVKLWKEDGKLCADIEFDQNDDFAKTIESKVEGGYINMCSPGLEPITLSEDSKHLLQGQTRRTLVKSELIEISIADIGSNRNALKLYDTEMNVVNLTAGDDNIIPLINSDSNKLDNKMNEFKKKVAVLLAMDPEASDDSIMTALKGKMDLATKADDYKSKYDALDTAMKNQTDSQIVALVNANKDKKFTADKEEFYLKLGRDSGLATLQSVLDNMPQMQKPGSVINLSNQDEPGGEGGEIKSFEDLKKLGMEKVELFRKEKPSEYIRLFKAEYGHEPNMDDK